MLQFVILCMILTDSDGFLHPRIVGAPVKISGDIFKNLQRRDSLISRRTFESADYFQTNSSQLQIRIERSLSPQQGIYLWLTSVFCTCLIIADVIGGKLFEIPLPFPVFGFKVIEHTCGMITFPITFLLGDVINEYYGPEATKQTVYIGLVMSIFVFSVISISQPFSYACSRFNITKTAYDSIFGSAKILYIGSLCAYLIGQLSNIWLFGVIKRLTKGKFLWLRSTGSTVISQMLDSFIVSYLGFGLGKTLTGQIPASFHEVLNISITGYGLKFLIALAMTPLLYGLRYLMTKIFKLEAVKVNYSEMGF